jgi:hypothetical protein
LIRSASCRSCRHCDHRNSFSKNVARCFSPHFPRGRDDLRVVRLNAVAGAPYFIYPAPRLCASARAKALYGAFPPREGRPPRRPKALLPQVSAPAAASTVPLTVLSQVSYRQISNLLNPIIHFVHFFLNKAAGCAIHTVLVLRHSPDGALLNSSRSGNHFVAFSRLTNGGSAPSDWILFSNGRDDLRILPRASMRSYYTRRVHRACLQRIASIVPSRHRSLTSGLWLLLPH